MAVARRTLNGLSIIFLSVFLFFFPAVAGAQTAGEEKEVIERVIKIEGSIERPRVIYIVPRRKLWGGDVTAKSFRTRLLTVVAPEEKQVR